MIKKEAKILENKMQSNRIKKIHACGQSVWLDFIRRQWLQAGGLEQLIREDGITGVTSNPAIFEKAITVGDDYTEEITRLFKNTNLSIPSIYEQLVIRDIQVAADILRPIYESTQRRDGYVSLEVPPNLARDTRATIQEGKRLWHAVNRPNVMIKVPGTPEGIPAICELIAAGININVTLLFSLDAYIKSADAYLEGLERRQQANLPIDHIASVASFFVSRLDAMLEKRIEEQQEKPKELQALKGKMAIAYAKKAYQIFKARQKTPRHLALAAAGAQPQRLLWASTGTKDPALSDVLYVEALIGRETVNTVPPLTLDAFRTHGEARENTLENDLMAIEADFTTLERHNISLATVTQDLLEEGIQLFSTAFQRLLSAIEHKKVAYFATLEKNPPAHVKFHAPNEQQAITQALEQWESGNCTQRLYAKEAQLWTNTEEAQWMDWLDIVVGQPLEQTRIAAIVNTWQSEGMAHIVVLGMGGSSLCPLMLARIFPQPLGFPQLHILDSTDPEQIRALETSLVLEKTIFIVSSKSGGTLEPTILQRYFATRLQAVLGREDVGQHFVAITDPKTVLDTQATTEKFRAIFYGVPGIGGRYSALSNFGLLPAGCMGIDLKDFLQPAVNMRELCKQAEAHNNPGVLLGIILGVCAQRKKNKITFIISPEIDTLGMWLEQLLAESTGKHGTGLIPINGETLSAPSVYQEDRVFVYIRVDTAPSAAQENGVNALEQAGHVVIRLSLAQPSYLSAQLFQWEIATVVAAHLLSINPFDQPDVETAKIRALQFAQDIDASTNLPELTPLCSEDGLHFFAPWLTKNTGALACLSEFFASIRSGDYVVFMPFLTISAPHQPIWQEMRALVRTAKKVATTLGVGPRFLHSTGQAYKGGENTGVFLQITADHTAHDLHVPGHRYTFGAIINAQARADFEELLTRQRRVLRIDVGHNVEENLLKLKQWIAKILI